MKGGLRQEDVCWDTVVVGGRQYREYPVSDEIMANILRIRDKVGAVNVFHNETPTRELLAKLKILKN